MANDLPMLSRSYARLPAKDAASVKNYMLEMAAYINIVIDNADVYEDHGGAYRIWRYTPPRAAGACCWALADIDHIEKAAVDCIDATVKHKIPK